jgi:hypothetical protein
MTDDVVADLRRRTAARQREAYAQLVKEGRALTSTLVQRRKS